MTKARSESMLTDLSTAEITIRRAYPGDQVALIRLAELDSADVLPPGPLLVAEVDCEPRVALSLADGTAIADPYHHTAAILALLRRHAGSLEPARRSRRLERVLPWRRGRDRAGAPLRVADRAIS